MNTTVLNRRGLKEQKGIAFSDEHLRRLWKSEKFPRPFKLAPGGQNYWSEDEIDEWLASRKAAAV